LEISDDVTGLSILASRPARLRRYKAGVNNLLSEMLKNYCVNKLAFESAPIIIDIGANIGEFSIASSVFLHPRTRFICIEPDVLEYSALVGNIKKFGSPNSVCLNYALSNNSGKLDFYLNNDSGDSSLIQNLDYEQKVTVEVRTLDELMLNILSPNDRVAIIKLEAEGWEPEVLMGSERTLKQTHYVAADLGPERQGVSTYLACKELLGKHGFVEVLQRDHRYLFQNFKLIA